MARQILLITNIHLSFFFFFFFFYLLFLESISFKILIIFLTISIRTAHSVTYRISEILQYILNG